MGTIANIDKQQSALIKAVRFPLIVMVVFIHTSPGASTEAFTWPFEKWHYYAFFSEMVAQHLFAIATRCFFFFSGFLFFRYLEKDSFGWDSLLGKWKSRFWTLLIPFVLWNFIYIAATILKNHLFGLLGGEASSDEMKIVGYGPLYWLLTGPADFPLWYIRDLIIMSLAAPLFYYASRWAKWPSLILLLALYLSTYNPGIPSMQAIFYFGLGVWMGTYKIDFLPLCRKVRIPAAIGAVVLLLLSTSQVCRPWHLLLINLFIPFGIISFLNLFDLLIADKNLCERLCGLSKYVFFIYAIHEIYILGWTKGIFMRVLGDSYAAAWLRFFIVPLAVLAICMLLYHVLEKLCPRALAFVCGGRTK